MLENSTLTDQRVRIMSKEKKTYEFVPVKEIKFDELVEGNTSSVHDSLLVNVYALIPRCDNFNDPVDPC